MVIKNQQVIQPWHVYLVQNTKLDQLKATMKTRSTVPPNFDTPPYAIYPEPLSEPYDSRRNQCGERQYGALNIDRDDHEGRLRYVYNNHQCFGAPAVMFLYIDKDSGPSQWADMGIYLQSVMLLLTEAGIDCCAQISWNIFHKTVRDVLEAPEQLTLYCGLSIGYKDPDAAVNTVRADRASKKELLTIYSN